MRIVKHLIVFFIVSVRKLIESGDSNSLAVCENLPILNNGELILAGREPPFAVNEFIPYKCDKDYKSDQINPHVTCVLQGNVANWTNVEEACKLIVQSCHDPGDIENADRIGNTFLFPHNITYICRKGFKLKDSTGTRYCLKSGRWLPPNMPTCEAIICPPLNHPQNGEVLVTNRKLNSIATYRCSKKYSLSGSTIRVCQEDGTWNGSNPVCTEIRCMDPGNLKNGRIIGLKDTYVASDIIIFRCDNKVHVTSKCTEYGEWSARPPICSEVEDPNLDKSTTDLSTVHDSGTVLTCEDPGTIKNGKRDIVGFNINSTVSFICDSGYTIQGQSTLLCLENGKWDLEKLPICVKPLSIPVIIGIAFGVIFICLFIGVYIWYRYGIKGIQSYGRKCKALTADATDIEEVTGLEKEQKHIPVTVL